MQVKKGVSHCFNNLAASEYAEGIAKLVKHWELFQFKRLAGDYIEKQFM